MYYSVVCKTSFGSKINYPLLALRQAVESLLTTVIVAGTTTTRY